MDRRIFGIETELGVTATSEGQRRLTPDEVTRYMFRSVVAWGRSSNAFLTNGSRLYLDVGSHPEYATAECDRLVDLIAQDKAGERIVQGLADDAQARMVEEGVEGEVYVFKNNVDSSGTTYGCHENLLVSRATDLTRVTDTLVPFLVSRQITCGAGKLVVDPQGRPTYAVSQRADHMWDAYASATTRSRPIINSRDEPHADAERFRRLHVIVGDSTLSETTTLLKVGSVDLVLRMVEAGVALPDLTLASTSAAIRTMSTDTTGRAEVPLANGGATSALAMQTVHYEAARDFVADGGSDDPVHERVLDLWGRVLTAIESERLDDVATEIDWVIKRRLIERYAVRNGLGLEHPRLRQLDLAYHDLHPTRGLFNLLQAKGLAARVVTDEQVERAVSTPPQTTRARLRGAFVAAAREARRDYSVDWVHLKLNDGNQRTLLCKDPLTYEDPRVDRMIEQITGATQPADSSTT
ncbi:Pup--protein ligase [Arsenicicoccus dermatophilus]|uniref:Pup--protein ligase n=1 Tax=Arsenicicoccus dermatophilus TaxID=1076331 RepID=UPI001F4C6CE7|nr:Pup--protein ligase [Arsenicicoccus dermatophilus]MCH8612495.1 Pup--protein ligase [Arsenicicoccus dermatophilus]